MLEGPVVREEFCPVRAMVRCRSETGSVPGCRTGFERVEFFAGFETHGLAGRDADFGAGARVASDAGFARTDAEDAESAEFDPVSCGESLLEAFEDGVDSRFSLGSRQACPLDDVMDNILLDQCRGPLTEENFALMCNSPLARCYWELAPLSISAYSNNISNLEQYSTKPPGKGCKSQPGWEEKA